MAILAQLFFTFLKIGAFTFGGGYAMLGIITDACVERKKWITHEEMMNITVIAETIPGPVAINCATFVGYRAAGLPGAIVATIGVVLPSFFVIYLISLFLEGFLEITVIANAFRGIKIGVGVLILQAGWRMIRKQKKTLLSWIILATTCALVVLSTIFSWNLSTIVLMAFAAVVSVVVFAARKGGERK